MMVFPPGSASSRYRVFRWTAVVSSVFLIIVVILQSFGSRMAWSTEMPDGSRVEVRVSAGTNHVFYQKPWHALVRAIPRLPKSIWSMTTVQKRDTVSPSFVIWYSFQFDNPDPAIPEFVLGREEGNELTLQRIASINITPKAISGAQCALYAEANPPRNDKRLWLRVYGRDKAGKRYLVDEWEFKNPLYGS